MPKWMHGVMLAWTTFFALSAMQSAVDWLNSGKSLWWLFLFAVPVHALCFAYFLKRYLET